MSWLSAAWQRNKGAIASIATNLATGNVAGAVSRIASDARGEVGRVIARSGAPPEAAATIQAQADNAINVANAAFVPAGAGPSLLNPLGAQGSQRVAIGSQTVSVNTIALVGGGVLLLVILLMISKR